MSAILPCPFCSDSDPAIDEIEMGIWAVCCNDCRTIGPHCDGEQAAEVAIARWNERTSRLDVPIKFTPDPALAEYQNERQATKSRTTLSAAEAWPFPKGG